MIWIETHHVFGVTSEYLKRSPQELAKDKGNSSFIQPIKLDDVIALAYKLDDDGLAIKVAVCIKNNEKKKPKGKEESEGIKKAPIYNIDQHDIGTIAAIHGQATFSAIRARVCQIL